MSRMACLRILNFLYAMSPTNEQMVEAIRELERELGEKKVGWVCGTCRSTYKKPHDLDYSVKTICNNWDSPCCVCGTLMDSPTFDLTEGAGLLRLRKELGHGNV